MAATMEIHEMSGADTGTDKTSGTIRFKDADNATVDTNNPLVVPAADTIYSYTKSIKDQTASQYASIKVAYSFDFGRKTQKVEKDVNKNINSSLLRVE